jgi:hypothetical protein
MGGRSRLAVLLTAVKVRHMGGVMLDRRSREELSGVLSLGLLSERIVLTLGRALRDEKLSDDDRQALDSARRLFELMTNEDVIVIDSLEDRMLTDESYLDALHVVQMQAPGSEIEESARRYLDILQSLIDGHVTPEERDDVTALRELFVEVGETALSRANDLSRTPQEHSWRPMHPLTLRS